MKLCVNYLEEVKELLEEGKIDFIDYIKLYSINADLSPIDWCVTKKDVMFHGTVGNAGGNVADKNFFENTDLELSKKYYEMSRTPYLSMHINARSGILPKEEEALEIIKENINRLKNEFNKDIILENVPARRDRGYYNYLTNPEFISKVINETSCGFLFDISHARVAAEVLNIPFEDYARRLPMDKLIEVHLAGCMKDSNGYTDANHSKMNEEDYTFLEELLKTSKTLQVVTLEYGTPVGRKLQDCPTVEYGKINEKAKAEVLEQLIRIKEILKI